MVTNNYQIVFALFSCLLLATNALANSETSPFEDSRSASVYFLNPIFDILDCTSEGVVDPAEVGEHFHPLFFSRDRDRSRTISRQEFTQFVPDKEKYTFIYTLIDKNSDNKITPIEFRDYLIFVIHDADTNKDGEVSRAEAGIKTVVQNPVKVKHALQNRQH